MAMLKLKNLEPYTNSPIPVQNVFETTKRDVSLGEELSYGKEFAIRNV